MPVNLLSWGGSVGRGGATRGSDGQDGGGGVGTGSPAQILFCQQFTCAHTHTHTQLFLIGIQLCHIRYQLIQQNGLRGRTEDTGQLLAIEGQKAIGRYLNSCRHILCLSQNPSLNTVSHTYRSMCRVFRCLQPSAMRLSTQIPIIL